MPNPKTTDQLRAIFGLGRGKGLEKEDLESLAAEVTAGRVERLSLLSFDEANAMISRLGGEPFALKGPTPARTVNYHKQKAGVETIESARQLKMIRDLARGRNMGEDGLAKLANRMRLPWPAQTTRQGNKVMEALKSMIARDARSAKEAA